MSHHRQGRLHLTRAYQIPGLKGGHRVTVYLPPGYDEGRQLYPVAYMFDGQNLYGDEGSFSGGWHLHHALNARYAEGKTVPIVMGIHHGGATRMEELSPWPVRNGPGLADHLLDWIVGTLSVYASEDLRILKGPENTLLGGSSLGGLMALYGMFRHSDFFGNAMSMSPSLWVHNGEIFNYVAAAPITGNPRVYMDCGGREAHGVAIEHAKLMVELLERKGFIRGKHILWKPDKGGAHTERCWRRRLPRALRYFYD